MDTRTGEIIENPTPEQKAQPHMLEMTEEEAKYVANFPEEERLPRLFLREYLKDKKYDVSTKNRVTNAYLDAFSMGLELGREGK